MTISLKARLWIPTAITCGIYVVMGAATLLGTEGKIKTSTERAHVQQEKVDAANSWMGLTEANAARAFAIMASTDAGLGSALKPAMSETSAAISKIQDRIKTLATSPEEVAALDAVSTARTSYLDLRKKLTAAKAEGTLPGDAVPKLEAAIGAYVGAQKTFVDLERRMVAEGIVATSDERMNTVYLSLGLLGFVNLLLVGSTFVNIRSLLRSLREVIGASERIARGDLRQEIRDDRKDELGQMFNGLGDMNRSLRKLITEVRSGSENIQVASSEIAAGNADLSTRTEHTASSLQETSSAMQQLTGTVRQSADAAAQANQLASSAADAAERGGQVVDQVVRNMDDISASSRKIGDIISVIDGIAFQTNILALNAAVEAARAGEQGRGFAVVAGEVRTLAQRSAGAAREIKALINASVEKVEAGSSLVQDAGSTMGEIVSSVRRVSDIIGEITASAAEQSQGIGQVDSAVTQLDQMTQQNAALVEESAAAAISLKDQAERLAGLVATFQIDDGGAARKASAPAHVTAAKAAIGAAKAAPARPAVKVSAPVAAPAPAAPASTGASDDWETF